MLTITRDAGTPAQAEHILRSLPAWFGQEEPLMDYAHSVETLPTLWAFTAPDAAPAGFLSLARRTDVTWEVSVVAVRAGHHGSGIGSALLAAGQDLALAQGARLLEVKTLGPSHPDEGYARTRAFYRARGFLDLEELDGIWPGQPCLIMVKPLG